MIHDIKFEYQTRRFGDSPLVKEFVAPVDLQIDDSGMLTALSAIDDDDLPVWTVLTTVSMTLPVCVTSVGAAVFKHFPAIIKTESVLSYIGEEAFMGVPADSLQYIKIDKTTKMESRCFYAMERPHHKPFVLPKNMTPEQIRASSVVVSRYPVDLVRQHAHESFSKLEPWLMTVPTEFHENVFTHNQEQLNTVLDVMYGDHSDSEQHTLGPMVFAPLFPRSVYRILGNLPYYISNLNFGEKIGHAQGKPYNPWRFARLYYQYPDASFQELAAMTRRRIKM